MDSQKIINMIAVSNTIEGQVNKVEEISQKGKHEIFTKNNIVGKKEKENQKFILGDPAYN